MIDVVKGAGHVPEGPIASATGSRSTLFLANAAPRAVRKSEGARRMVAESSQERTQAEKQ